MLFIQQFVIPRQVAQQNQTTAIHWTLVAGNSILILFNIFMRNAVGSAISGTMVGMNLPTFGGKHK